ncbi:hypothetical protein EDD85DRAFT_791187 [Armillaria nabsnona]|nr:hypothetical protein EDD85DRAFT_791187 [Armillaria nabsnona]
MYKGVILQKVRLYMMPMQRQSEWADSANSMQRSKVTKAESSMIEKEAVESKPEDFVMVLYLMSMHSNKAEELACLQNHLFAVEHSASVGCILIYDMWSLEIQRNNITCEVTKRIPGIA